MKNEEIRPNGRDMYKQSAHEFAESNITAAQKASGSWCISTESEKDPCCGHRVGDIVNIHDGWLNNMELEIIKIVNDEYAGQVVLKVTNSDLGKKAGKRNNYMKIKVGTVLDDYGILILGCAVLVKRGTGTASSVYKRKSKISKYILEVEDYSISTEDWKKDAFQQENINIGIMFFTKDGDMSDQDPLDDLPELETLPMGEIQIAENGYMGLTTKYTLNQIKRILTHAGFNVKK